MRLVVQRVNTASVKVDNRVVGKIKKGYLVFVAVTDSDTEEISQTLAEKVINLRIMSDDSGIMNLNCTDAGGAMLVVSQFTLYADTKKGNRPSFVRAAKPEFAKNMYNHFIECLKDKGFKVETGIFGAMMTITAQLDGPVTINLEK